MTKLHYIGFNGYQQCPQNQRQLSKVVHDWICINNSEILNISCNHRTVAVETVEEIKLYGILCAVLAETLHVVKKPAKINCFAVNEGFLIAASKTNIWKLSFEDIQWKKLSLKFLNEEHQKIWEEDDNIIIKLSLSNNEVILLISNGSVWKMTDCARISLLYPYDVDKAIDVSSGFEHSLILTESGCVLSFGNGSRGQLGNGDLNSMQQPVQIAALEGLKVLKIAAGGWHSCAITDSSDLCTWGWNNYGQLSAFEEEGKEEEISLTSTPIFVDVGSVSNAEVVDVSCGSRHTIVKLESGEIYSCGWNTYRQLGINSSAEKIPKFTKADIQSLSGKLICGPWYSILMEKS